MSSENNVRIIMAESLRFLKEGSSASGKPGAKVRPKGVADAQTVDIPSPPNFKHKGHIQTVVRGYWLPPKQLAGWREKLMCILRCPYRKPTQVGRMRILRPTREGLLRNSAKSPRNFGRRGASSN